MQWNTFSMGLSAQNRAELHAAVGSGSYDGSVSSRAQIVLWHDEGYWKADIAAMSGASRPTVDKWLARYERFGLEGLVSMKSPGGPRQIPDEVRAKVLALTRTTPPSALGISHWSSTEMARYIKKTEGVCVADVGVAALAGEQLEAVAAGNVQDLEGSAL
jgi:transposase